MNTALSWIKAYVPELECTDQEYTDAMTLTGTKVEGFERLRRGQLNAPFPRIYFLQFLGNHVRFLKILPGSGIRNKDG